ncbi:hypothetical protein COLO4_00199 [Corchorus olitorius]|uniref:Uncharacterized protein n=1 Tax=Corchorus olitorius TaxID=93759 RepID=A0A1R3L4C7_9ROSI|nr:hypothetical protein COLO4_00199 [Corchorus olitorius]
MIFVSEREEKSRCVCEVQESIREIVQRKGFQRD